MSKGADTRERILDRAFRLAGRDGLSGLSIGGLAGELGLSKSGLFAHFGSKEDLLIEVLRLAALRYEEEVVRPAFRASRGEPRIRRWFENWMAWLSDPATPGGCVMLTAAVELDDREGRLRDFLAGTQRQLFEALSKAARLGIEAGHFRPDLDREQFGFEIYGILAAYNHFRRLLRDPRAKERAQAAFERCLAAARRTV